ncbi:hypothetical protein FHR32_000934 [Streptosporangium album]|uniref:DUF4097 domain-containing protein n=1 Tax=Streptosporangium album TaxID=47479 RepID=A0A7W7W825_9ACTN|nr:DUF4097 family beta strand repeat-containing protein [Streptosporangium album]MBB4936629.1 hypothetical protein [Streptosporangium album]
MPAFPTSGPVTLHVKFPAGDLDITATQREDAVVEVRPANPSRSADVQLAADTRVEYVNGTIHVETPERPLSMGRSPRLEVLIGLPEGSRVDFKTASADARMAGPLGEVSVRTASGDTRISHCATLDVNTASGDVICDVTGGDVRLKSSSGDIRLREVYGKAEIVTASGDLDLGVVGGGATVKSASGNVRIGGAGESVQVKGASADVTVESITAGAVSVTTASGDVRIGVAAGTSAWLDVSSLSGRVASSLEQSDRPADDGAKAEIHVRTLSGDISIIRAHA